MTTTLSSNDIIKNARADNLAVPALNVPYLPMIEPMVRALRDTDTFGFIEVARPEWEKFEAVSIAAVREEYERVKDEQYTRLHLDHVPVIDEDSQSVIVWSALAAARSAPGIRVVVKVRTRRQIGSRRPIWREPNSAITRKRTRIRYLIW